MEEAPRSVRTFLAVIRCFQSARTVKQTKKKQSKEKKIITFLIFSSTVTEIQVKNEKRVHKCAHGG